MFEDDPPSSCSCSHSSSCVPCDLTRHLVPSRTPHLGLTDSQNHFYLLRRFYFKELQIEKSKEIINGVCFLIVIKVSTHPSIMCNTSENKPRNWSDPRPSSWFNLNIILVSDFTWLDLTRPDLTWLDLTGPDLTWLDLTCQLLLQKEVNFYYK